MRKISGKIIVITGATGGLGKYLREKFAAENTVINLSRSCAPSQTDIPCDVSDFVSVKTAFGIIKERFGRVDILINNAGYGLFGATELLEPEQVEKQFSVNFGGVFNASKCALPLMGKNCKIINISSACAIFPLPFRTMYCASKAAVSMFSHSLKIEVAPYGIDVTAICPGDIKTSFNDNRVRSYVTNERYGDSVETCGEQITARAESRMSIGYAGEKIYKIICKKRYKPMYIVGKQYKFLYAFYRILPLKVVFGAIGKMFLPKDKNR